MEKRRNFTGYATVTLASGDILTLTDSDFTVNNNSFTDSVGGSGLPLGEAICRTIQIEIANFDEKYSAYDFVGAEILLKLQFKLSGTTESFDIGKFTVIDPATYGETIIITALDDMRKTDRKYTTTIEYPATVKTILADMCNTCGIPLATASFANDSFTIEERPSNNYHFRTLIGYIAMIAGGNARINRSGALEIISYDFSALEEMAVLGGTFAPWTDGDTLSGGTLNPWTTGDTTAAGDFIGSANYHLLRNFKNLKVDTDEIEITGISMTVENDMGVQDLISGTEGYVLNIDNPLLVGKEEAGLALIASVLVGGKMRKFEGDHIAYPLAEFMDPCLVIDRKGNMYPSILTDIDFEFFGFTKFKNSAVSKEALKSKASSKYQQELIRIEQKTEDLVQAEKTAREEAIDNLNNTLKDSSGMYVSDVSQSDGSTIRYLHDKPSLAESQNVIKITAEAIGISNDGGATYPYGFTLNGETITKYLYAEGIDADYIIAGRISDATGQNYWDLEKGELVIKKATIDGSLISVTVTADQITTGKIQDSTGANYWDLDAGKMVITNATIENIDADEIVTGRIADKKGNNYWDMDTGEMTINKATINVSLDADNITAGKITDATGSNYWDLDSGTLKITNAEIDGATISNINANDITTGSLTVKDKDGNTLFNADIANKEVNIANFTVKNNALYSGITSIDALGEGVYIGTDGIKLGDSDNAYQLLRLGAVGYYGKNGNIALVDGYGVECVSNDTSNSGIRLSHNGSRKGYIYHNGIYRYTGTISTKELLTWDGVANLTSLKINDVAVTDYIVEQGTSGIWTYEKWNSGRAEVFGRLPAGGINIETALGSWFRCYSIMSFSSYAYPFTFSAVPNVTTSFATNNSKGALVWITKDSTTELPPECYLIRPTAETSVSGYINVHAKGRWK